MSNNLIQGTNIFIGDVPSGLTVPPNIKAQSFTDLVGDIDLQTQVGGATPDAFPRFKAFPSGATAYSLFLNDGTVPLSLPSSCSVTWDSSSGLTVNSGTHNVNATYKANNTTFQPTSANTTTFISILNFGGTPFTIFDASNLRVGINTSPTKTLDVGGNMQAISSTGPVGKFSGTGAADVLDADGSGTTGTAGTFTGNAGATQTILINGAAPIGMNISNSGTTNLVAAGGTSIISHLTAAGTAVGEQINNSGSGISNYIINTGSGTGKVIDVSAGTGIGLIVDGNGGNDSVQISTGASTNGVLISGTATNGINLTTTGSSNILAAGGTGSIVNLAAAGAAYGIDITTTSSNSGVRITGTGSTGRGLELNNNTTLPALEIIAGVARLATTTVTAVRQISSSANGAIKIYVSGPTTTGARSTVIARNSGDVNISVLRATFTGASALTGGFGIASDGTAGTYDLSFDTFADDPSISAVAINAGPVAARVTAITASTATVITFTTTTGATVPSAFSIMLIGAAN